MQTKLQSLFIALALFAAVDHTIAQGTAFTYQGQLVSGGAPANGSYDLTFSLFSTNASGVAIAGPVTNSATAVTNGLFTTTIDFGAGIFTGTSNWLEIAVRTNDGGSFSTLAPRQQVTPTPYAIFSSTAGNVNGLTIQPNLASGAPNVIGGSSVNFVNPGTVGAFIGGGGATNYSGAAGSNSVSGDFGTVGGGFGNNIQGGAYNTVGGGVANIIQPDAYATISGGDANQIHNNAFYSTIGGGDNNSINDGHDYSVIGGGGGNSVNGAYATVPGGNENNAGADYTFAAGQNAWAVNDGAFVWADHSSSAIFGSTGTNQFLIRAQGGVGINTNNPNGAALNVNGTVVATNFVGPGAGLTGISGSAIAAGSIGNAAIANNAISAGQINSGQVVKSLDGLYDAVSIVAGANVILQTNSQTLTISASGSSASSDVLGKRLNIGTNNTLSGTYASIAGGTNNTASGFTAFVGGGYQNVASGIGSFIGGGGYDGATTAGNTNAGGAAVIGGGVQNTIQTASIESTIGGGYLNTINSGTPYSTISGGIGNNIQGSAWDSTIGGGRGNIASGYGSFIGGGGSDEVNFAGNVNSGNAAVIGGGVGNVIHVGAQESVIGGGYQNMASGIGSFIGGGGYDGNAAPSGNFAGGGASVIGGGYGNMIPSGNEAVIGGGNNNTNSAPGGVIGGGEYNFVPGYLGVVGGGGNNQVTGLYGTVPGGDQNVAGQNSFAAGHRAKATHQGSFVWADSTDADFSDDANNEFYVRASEKIFLTTTNGCYFYLFGGDGGSSSVTLNDGVNNDYLFLAGGEASLGGISAQISTYNGGGLLLESSGRVDVYTDSTDTSGMYMAAGGSGWNMISDRNMKENFVPTSPKEVLDRLAAIPISTWNYKTQDKAIRHLGPMAQDFHAAFAVGEDDKHINNLDEEGVALAAIQGLNQKVEEQKSELKARDADIQQLKQSVAELKQLVSRLAQTK